MLKNVNISRNDTIYKEIEEFEEYEITNSITYEMAIRNCSYIEELIERVDEINTIFLRYLRGEYTDETIRFAIERNSDDKERNKIISDLFISKIMTSLRNMGINEYATYELFKIDQIQEFEIIKYAKKTFDKEKINRIADEVNVVVKDGYRIVQTEDCLDDETFVLKNQILPDFKRPFLKFRNGKHAEVMLNLALPTNELIKYLKIIKNDFNQDLGSIKTRDELLGINCYLSENKKALKKPKAIIYADYFFSYDYFKKALQINPELKSEEIYAFIDNEINDYHNGDIGTNYLKHSTFMRNVWGRMRYMIEQEGYIELITNIKPQKK